MGGTQQNHVHNKAMGNILMWKRKAEIDLVNSGMEYVIIHAGGLLDEPGGERELVVGCDDDLLRKQIMTVPRTDVAAMAVACIDAPEATNRSFDLASLPV